MKCCGFGEGREGVNAAAAVPPLTSPLRSFREFIGTPWVKGCPQGHPVAFGGCVHRTQRGHSNWESPAPRSPSSGQLQKAAEATTA